MFEPTPVKSDRGLSAFGRLRRESGRSLGPLLAKIQAHSTHIGQFGAESTELDQAWSSVGQICPDIDKHRPTMARTPTNHGPESAIVCPNDNRGPASGQFWPELDPLPGLEEIRPRLRPNFGRVGPPSMCHHRQRNDDHIGTLIEQRGVRRAPEPIGACGGAGAMPEPRASPKPMGAPRPCATPQAAMTSSCPLRICGVCGHLLLCTFVPVWELLTPRS